MNIKKGPWPKRTPLTLEEQKALLGRHWVGLPEYQPKPAHTYPGCWTIDREKAKRFKQQGFI